MSIVLEVRHLSVAYEVGVRSVRAVIDADLKVCDGQAVGLVGESGCGKSTIARAVVGLLPKGIGVIRSGQILIDGQDVTTFGEAQWRRLRGSPVAIVFQDPLSYLNPVMRAGDQIAEAVRIHDREIRSVHERVVDLLGKVQLPPSAMRAYPHELSGGMRQRVLLAIALACRPRLLVADEPTTALDVTVQAEILRLLARLQRELGMALLLISHDLRIVASLCERVYVMYAGSTVEWGPMLAVVASPNHPYTMGLMNAAQGKRDEHGRFATIHGDVPSLDQHLVGCSFAPRCPYVMEKCRTLEPPPLSVHGEEDQKARCWLLDS